MRKQLSCLAARQAEPPVPPKKVSNSQGWWDRRFACPNFHYFSCLFLVPALVHAQTQRRVFSRIMTGEPYTLECYLPQITNGPNFPSWSPDGQQIAFAMKGSIWRIRLGESTAYEMTAGASYDSMPAWSPDGNWIVYTSETNEEIHLRLL